MAPWTLLDSTDTCDRTYTRPLSLNERGYYWDSCFHGVTDLVWHYVVEARSELFHRENVVRTWIAMKQRYPLLGSQVEACDESDSVRFVVSEKRLGEVLPGELEFRSIATEKEVQVLIEDIINGDQRSIDDLPARIYILHRTDKPSLHHVIVNTAHFITDGVSHTVLCRMFFDILSSPPAPEVPYLEHRLAMEVASEDLYPARRMSVPRQKWRSAIADIIFSIRRDKMRGGHSIPGLYTPNTYRTPPISCNRRTMLPASSTAVILETCRQHNITLAATLPVITQLATARVLHQLYLRGDILQDEWEQRRRQPMHFFLPVSLRPYLDEEWIERGGVSAVSLSVNLFYCTLPFMPSIDRASMNLAVGMPSFSNLLSQERFILRCNMIKKQMADYIKHPLFLEIVQAGSEGSVARRKSTALRWKESQQSDGGIREERASASIFENAIYTVGISSGGNIDRVQPLEYPIPKTHPLSSQFTAERVSDPNPTKTAFSSSSSKDTKSEPILRINSWESHLHVRPAYFYLGAVTSQKRITLLLSWDGNVYDHTLMRDWLKEVENGMMWYLGGENRADRDGQQPQVETKLTSADMTTPTSQ